jgi:hypothetical protein
MTRTILPGIIFLLLPILRNTTIMMMVLIAAVRGRILERTPAHKRLESPLPPSTHSPSPVLSCSSSSQRKQPRIVTLLLPNTDAVQSPLVVDKDSTAVTEMMNGDSPTNPQRMIMTTSVHSNVSNNTSTSTTASNTVLHSQALRGNLTRVQTNRDPLQHYEIITVLGVGEVLAVWPRFGHAKRYPVVDAENDERVLLQELVMAVQQQQLMMKGHIVGTSGVFGRWRPCCGDQERQHPSATNTGEDDDDPHDYTKRLHSCTDLFTEGIIYFSLFTLTHSL